MPVFAVSIQKEEEYFGGIRPFGNTYHFDTDLGQTFNDETVALRVLEAERTITQASVTFTGWRTWGPTDGLSLENVMRETGDVALPGLAAITDGMYREVCALVYWQLPRSEPLNRRRWCRKFIRCPGYDAAFSPGTAAGRQPMTEAAREYIRTNYAQVVANPGVVEDFPLVTAEGVRTTTAGEVRPYLYTRQIGR